MSAELKRHILRVNNIHLKPKERITLTHLKRLAIAFGINPRLIKNSKQGWGILLAAYQQKKQAGPGPGAYQRELDARHQRGPGGSGGSADLPVAAQLRPILPSIPQAPIAPGVNLNEIRATVKQAAAEELAKAPAPGWTHIPVPETEEHRAHTVPIPPPPRSVDFSDFMSMPSNDASVLNRPATEESLMGGQFFPVQDSDSFTFIPSDRAPGFRTAPGSLAPGSLQDDPTVSTISPLTIQPELMTDDTIDGGSVEISLPPGLIPDEESANPEEISLISTGDAGFVDSDAEEEEEEEEDEEESLHTAESSLTSLMSGQTAPATHQPGSLTSTSSVANETLDAVAQPENPIEEAPPLDAEVDGMTVAQLRGFLRDHGANRGTSGFNKAQLKEAVRNVKN